MDGLSTEYFIPSTDVVTSIVIPTIIFCIGMVVAMLIGINKCNKWELDSIYQIRRSRRIIRQITDTLREKNFNTIQKAKRARIIRAIETKVSQNNLHNRETIQRTRNLVSAPPPLYANTNSASGTSPPPAYEDLLLEELYNECI